MKCYGCLSKGWPRDQVDRHWDGQTYCFACLGRCECGWWPKSYCGPPCPGYVDPEKNEAQSSRLSGLDGSPLGI